MEQQFILRLDKKIDLKKAVLTKNDNEVSITYGGETKTTQLHKLKTIVESYKILESKCYKISDLTYIADFTYQNTGLTKPMKYPSTRFKKLVKIESDIDDKLNELLNEDSKAIKVTWVDDRIDELAAEIEQEIVEPEIKVEIPVSNKEIEKLEEEIRKKEELMQNAKNPIIKKRFEDALEKLKEKYEEMKK